MVRPITVLWLLDEPDIPAERDERFHHVMGDPAFPAVSIVGLWVNGAVLAVVRTEEEGQQAIGCGADEAILASQAAGEALEKALERTATRARARIHRDLFLIDLIRKDDSTALELVASALGEELSEPLSRASEESQELVRRIGDPDEQARRARSIAETVSNVTQVVERMRELLDTEPTDEVVDFAEVTREVTLALSAAVRPVAALEIRVPGQPCLVGMPRWQTSMTVASLVANAVASVAARGGEERKVSVRVSAHRGMAVLEVEDDGAGMTEDHRPFAADPFFTTSGKGHLGLGLTLVSARVRRAGGEIIIESDPGAGTTVRVFLPLIGSLTKSDEPSN